MTMFTGLLVDDDPHMLQILARFCEHHDICFDLAENGEQAINKLQKNSYNFILTDIQMPVVDGYAVVQFCQDNCKDLPIFVMSGDPGAFQNSILQNAVIQGAFTKPLTFKTIIPQILEKINPTT